MCMTGIPDVTRSRFSFSLGWQVRTWSGRSGLMLFGVPKTLLSEELARRDSRSLRRDYPHQNVMCDSTEPRNLVIQNGNAISYSQSKATI